MIFLLDPEFSNKEKTILNTYAEKYNAEIQIVYSIDMDAVKGIQEPHRMIFVGGLYLCEDTTELLIWNMGQLAQGVYSFWGKYGDLENALQGL